MSVPWNVAGKQVLITGATSGIGKAAALELARRGASLAIIARDAARADSLVGEIVEISPDPPPRLFRANLAALGEVRAVGAEVTEALGHIDVMINNAGMAARTPRRTPDGFDEMLAANYLGPFLLTHLVLPRIRKAKRSRMIVTGSEAHRMAGRFDPERFEHLGPYLGLGAQVAYGRTKLLDMLFADELARRLQGSGVTVNSACPGLVSSGLVRETWGAGPLAGLLSMTPLVRTRAAGARILLRLAADADVQDANGQFFTSTPGMQHLPPVAARRDPAVARRVYERTCQLVGAVPLEHRPRGPGRSGG